MFFMTSSNIPDGVGFSAFDITHILWLIGIAIFCAVCCFLFRKLDPKKQKIALIIAGLAVILEETTKNVIIGCVGKFTVGYLPLHLCGINILLIIFDLIKPTNAVRQFLYYFCIPGALLALIFPNWTNMPFWNFFHLHSFLVHAYLLLYPLLLVTGGFVKPSIKAMPICVLILVGLAIPIYFVNLKFDTNFMFLMRPGSGNPLEIFKDLFGNHLWGFPILLPIVMFVMYLPIFVINKLKKHKQKLQKETVKA